ncbi:MAG: SPASM domain-containing protein [Paludibacteraceae bacterium]|nr:SPASM domain-containing protein [Paludibacteraceae bacterium]
MSVVLTRYRLSNAIKCYVSYALNRLGSVRFLHRTPYTLHITPYTLHITHYTLHHTPLFVSVEPAAVCQLKCPECPVGQRQSSINRTSSIPIMPIEVFRRVLAECRKTAWVIQFYFQGEPLLNKDLPTMIREAHEAGLYTIVSTNAQAMTPELAEQLVASGLDRIIISMDGLTDESYNAYRIGGSLEKCKEALKWLRAAKNRTPYTVHHTPIIELQVLRLRSNEHEWTQFKREYKALGADRLVFKTAQLYDYANGHPLMPSDPKYSRYIQGKDGHFHRRPLGKGCFRVWSGVVITTTGDVLPCCYDKAHAHAYGNIMETPLAELFAGPRAAAFRKAAFQETPQICKECWK